MAYSFLEKKCFFYVRESDERDYDYAIIAGTERDVSFRTKTVRSLRGDGAKRPLALLIPPTIA